MIIYWWKHKHYREKYEVLVVASKENGRDVKTDYMVMSKDQHVGQNHNIKEGNKSFERMEQFRYFGTTLRNQIPCTNKLTVESFSAEPFGFQMAIQKYNY
jgi:hypothetical protein